MFAMLLARSTNIWCRQHFFEPYTTSTAQLDYYKELLLSIINQWVIQLINFLDEQSDHQMNNSCANTGSTGDVIVEQINDQYWPVHPVVKPTLKLCETALMETVAMH